MSASPPSPAVESHPIDQPAAQSPVESDIGLPPPVSLTTLRTGERGRLHAADLADRDRELLRALGLAELSRFRVCKAGDPWILQVRDTRVGLSDAVAHRLLVVPEQVEP